MEIANLIRGRGSETRLAHNQNCDGSTPSPVNRLFDKYKINQKRGNSEEEYCLNKASVGGSKPSLAKRIDKNGITKME